MEGRMTPGKGCRTWRAKLADRAFEEEVSADELATLWDEREACAIESGRAEAHGSAYEAIGHERPSFCPDLCGALAYQLDLAGFGKRWWS